MTLVKKPNKDVTIYRIFYDKKMVFESTDKLVVTNELSRLNTLAVREADEKNLPVEARKNYDLRIFRDPNKPIPKSPLFQDNFKR